MPNEFPQIEILFRAENLKKYPYWGLTKQDLKVYENNQICTVLKLRHFSKKEPINISIVVDHSGSMEMSYIEYIDYFNNDTTKFFEAIMNNSLPKIKTPLENAIKAVKGFLENFENEKDYIGLYAFDSNVDIQIKPTHNINSLKPILDSLKPTNSTAFFDAVFLATKSLKDLNGINVVIALTDGQDNSSVKTSKEVVSLARENNVPIYCIGLGDVMNDTLQLLADSTNGYYTYTKKSTALDSIYNLLNRKILAYYLMTYESANWASEDQERELLIQFKQTDTYVTNNSLEFELPINVIRYLKENEEKAQLEFMYLIGGIVGGTILLLGLTMFVIYKR